jgi:hypothetical protein
MLRPDALTGNTSLSLVGKGVVCAIGISPIVISISGVITPDSRGMMQA